MYRRPPKSPLFPYTTLSPSPSLVRACEIPEFPATLIPAAGSTSHWIPSSRQRSTSRYDDCMYSASANQRDRKSTRLNSSHQIISYAVFCLKKKNTIVDQREH